MTRRRHIVAYDIADDRRLYRVHKVMQGFGDPLQYSVFLCDLDPTEKIERRAALREAVHHGEDSVVIVDLGEVGAKSTAKIETIGVPREMPAAGPRIV